VIFIHEISDLHPLVIRFADRVVAAGMTVFLPVLFGEPVRPVTSGLLHSADLLRGPVLAPAQPDQARGSLRMSLQFCLVGVTLREPHDANVAPRASVPGQILGASASATKKDCP
jgi:hypothetical protein